jgi:isoamylase
MMLGATMDLTQETASFAVYSRNATRMEVWLYRTALGSDEVLRRPLDRSDDSVWRTTIPLTELRNAGIEGAIYYGYRAWGPNWPFHPDWVKGAPAGFRVDVDGEGNRFNPNKLLIDPYAVEISHDPTPRFSSIDPNEFSNDYYTGPGLRNIDTGSIAPKSVLALSSCDATTGYRPRRGLKDDIIYEVHVRGFTKSDPSIPDQYRGTFRGAALKAPYLKELGVTAVEFLPIFHFSSEQNDDGDPRGDNYWGYMTMGYFAPNRRYSSDQSPGGPTREFREMVKAFHDLEIKVILDVVYNHTAEGILRRLSDDDDSRVSDEKQLPDCACLLSFRGLDNASYYTLRSNENLDGGRRNCRYQDNSACGGALNVTNPAVQDFIIDSLRYWVSQQGVDGFRFDLAPVLGNTRLSNGFVFDAYAPNCLLQRMTNELPVRAGNLDVGVDLIAEPWGGAGDNTYQLGRFPDNWAEWNDRYRKVIRLSENNRELHDSLRRWYEIYNTGDDPVRPYMIADAVSGSDQLFRNGSPRKDPRPWNSINYVAAHDGHTLHDVFSFTRGEQTWDHDGVAANQRRAVRGALALLMTSAGVPMILGGDELYRTQDGCRNAVALDVPNIYHDWRNYTQYTQALAAKNDALVQQLRQSDDLRMHAFASAMIQFRLRYSCLRRDTYYSGTIDPNSNLPDIGWFGADGRTFQNDWNNPYSRFIAFRIDALQDRQATGVRSILVAYNWGSSTMEMQLPGDLQGTRWYRFADTSAWMEPDGNVDTGDTVVGGGYGLHEGGVAIFVEK